MLVYVSDMHVLHTICGKLTRKLVWFLKWNNTHQILISEAKMALAMQQSDIIVKNKIKLKFQLRK